MTGDVHSDLVLFENYLNEIYEKVFPLRTKYISEKRYLNPWLSNSLVKLFKDRSKLFRLNKFGLVDDNYYKKFRNSVTSSVRRAKADYFNRKFSGATNNIKDTWSTIKNLLGTKKKSSLIKSIIINGETLTDCNDICENFNTYFSSIGMNLDAALPSTNNSPLQYMSNPQQNSFYLSPVSPEEIGAIVSNLNRASGSIPIKVLKCARDQLSSL